MVVKINTAAEILHQKPTTKQPVDLRADLNFRILCDTVHGHNKVMEGDKGTMGHFFKTLF